MSEEIFGHRVELLVDGKLRLGASTKMEVKNQPALIIVLEELLATMKAPGVDLDDFEVLGKYSPSNQRNSEDEYPNGHILTIKLHINEALAAFRALQRQYESISNQMRFDPFKNPDGYASAQRQCKELARKLKDEIRLQSPKIFSEWFGESLPQA